MTISLEQFTIILSDLMEETFVNVKGIYLDKGTSLFETLDTITADMASRPVSATCATIAAQVEHIRFYLDTLARYLVGDDPGKVDWGEIWRTVRAVTPDEWEASKARLRASYEHINTLLKGFKSGQVEGDLLDALAIVIHTAYHLGEIRQALCTISTVK